MGNERTIRDSRWKLFYELNEERIRLFDLINDPYELKDLSTLPKNQAIIEKLKSELTKARAHYADDPSRSNSNFGPRRRGFFRRR